MSQYIPNPWWTERMRPSAKFVALPDEPSEQWNGFDLYDCGKHYAYAVKGGRLVSQCVTIDGLKRHLHRSGAL